MPRATSELPETAAEDERHRRHRARRRSVALLAIAVVGLAAAAFAGCSRTPEPVRTSRESLGTVVTVSVYGEPEEAKARRATDAAFKAMAGVERQLDAFDASSAVAAFNRRPYTPQTLPEDARAVLKAVADLGVEQWFSVSLLGVVRLYDFEGGGKVPSPAELSAEVALAKTFRPVFPPSITLGRPVGAETYAFSAPQTSPAPDPPGLDFGGAAKGLALDVAAKSMREDGMPAALLSAGSTTVAFGDKPGGEAWRVGIEDPRDPERVLATVVVDPTESSSPAVRRANRLVMSTSGDYQRYFERNGIRYHHILDPETGLPARGLRSLTVLGDFSALDSDILSTALFVAGREQAEGYARAHGLGLVTVDDRGEVRVVQPAAKDVHIRVTGR